MNLQKKSNINSKLDMNKNLFIYIMRQKSQTVHEGVERKL